MQNSYKIDLDKLQEYIDKLKQLYATYPQSLIAEMQDSKDCGQFHGTAEIVVKNIEKMQLQISGLIFNSIQYMEKIKKSVIENDEIASSKICRF